MSGKFGGRSPHHRHSWRQKGAATAVAGALLFPAIHGYVSETMPHGIGAYVRSLQEPSETPGPRISPIPLPRPEVTVEPSGLEAILDAPSRTVTLTPPIGLKLADASLALDESTVRAYDRAADALGSQRDLITTISYIEAEGGQLHVPWAYIDRVQEGQNATEAPADVPFGDHHVRLKDLNGILDQAAAARAYYSRFGESVVDAIEKLGWRASEDVASVLNDEQLAAALEDFHGESGMRRMAGLLATIPEGVEISDLTDPYESALAAAIVDAYTVHHFASRGIELDERARLLAYTAGPIATANALPHDHASLSDEEFAAIARKVSGEWGEWYVDAGQQTLTALRTYGFDHLRDTSVRFARYRAEPSSAQLKNATLGSIYLAALEDPGHIGSFENFRASVPSIENPNEAYELFVQVGAPDATYAQER